MSGIRHNLSWQTAHIARLSKAYNDVSVKTSNFATEYATNDHVTELIETSGFVTEEDVMGLIEQAQIEQVVGDMYLTKNEAANTYATYDSVTNAISPVSESLNTLNASVSSMNSKFDVYATTAYVDQQIEGISSAGGELDLSVLGSYATIEYVNQHIEDGDFAPKDHIHNEYYLKVDTMLSVTLTYEGNTSKEITIKADKSLLNTRVRLYCWNDYGNSATIGFGPAIIDKNGNVSREYNNNIYSDGSWYNDSTFTLCLKAEGRTPDASLYTGGNPIYGQEVIRLSEKFAAEDHTHTDIYYTKVEIDDKIDACNTSIETKEK